MLRFSLAKNRAGLLGGLPHPDNKGKARVSCSRFCTPRAVAPYCWSENSRLQLKQSISIRLVSEFCSHYDKSCHWSRYWIYRRLSDLILLLSWTGRGYYSRWFPFPNSISTMFDVRRTLLFLFMTSGGSFTHQPPSRRLGVSAKQTRERE